MFICGLMVFAGRHSAISFGLRKNGCDAVFLLSFAQLRRFRAFCHRPYRYLCRGCEKKVAFFMKKTSEKFCQFAELSYLCTRFRKKSGGRAWKSVFRVRMKKRSLTYCKQQQGSSRPFPSGSLGDSKETRYVDFIYNRIQWIPIERRCLGQRTDRFLFQLSDPHTLLYNI